MKFLVFLGLILCPFTSFSQTEPVQVLFNQSLIQQGDSLHFAVWCNTNEPMQVIVLSNDFLALQQNVQAAYSSIPFDLDTDSFPTGKYFILVTGDGIHIEKEFTIWKPE